MPTPNALHKFKIALSIAGLFLLVQTAYSKPGDGQKTGTDHDEPQSSIQRSTNPFQRFVGEWTLKDDAWSHNWGQGVEHIKIPHHHTLCKGLNTENSLLSIVDATSPRGHIFWSYNRTTNEVYHLSSFGQARNGVGKGRVDENGDVTLKVSFEGEQEGTHRIYTYKWISDDEYEMMSIQYNAEDKPTGLFYGGTFVRLPETKRRSN